ncbi:MAG: ribonuclease P protein subunit [Candidatus Thorarchaeota archaeon]|nr:MAG: ribonuclease P protein subunit [Candidatus Thorarchaeota archaeon]
MKISPDNLTRHELTGLTAHIVASSDPGLVCSRGVVIDESREMIHINTERGPVRAAKQVCVLDITLPDGGVVRVDGQKLRGRPEERLKKRLRRW